MPAGLDGSRESSVRSRCLSAKTVAFPAPPAGTGMETPSTPPPAIIVKVKSGPFPGSSHPDNANASAPGKKHGTYGVSFGASEPDGCGTARRTEPI